MTIDPHSHALHALARFFVAESSIGETLLRVSEITTAAMPSAQLAGISMLDENGRPTTAIFTDPDAPEIDAAQYESGRGPCLDAWRQQRVVRIDDMDGAADEYPEFAKAADAHGVKSTLSLPLAAGRPVGALNLYARVANGFSAEDETMGVDLAAAASIVLANSSAYWEATQLSEQLTQAMQSRAVIEQAKGMLMLRLQVDEDAAFGALRSMSNATNRKLFEVAADVIRTRAGESSTW